jgi:putative transposase
MAAPRLVGPQPAPGPPDRVAHSSANGSATCGIASARRPAATSALTNWLSHGGVNALAESVIGLFKTEVIHRRGPWRGFDDVEYATLEWVAWFNQQRLLEPLGDLPPAAYEERVSRAQAAQPALAALN